MTPPYFFDHGVGKHQQVYFTFSSEDRLETAEGFNCLTQKLQPEPEDLAPHSDPNKTA